MTDDLPKTRFQKDPLQRETVDIAEFVDIHSGRMLAPMSGAGLITPSGRPLMRETRLKLNEAMSEAARWWNKTGRFAMPDRPQKKGDEYLNQYGMASGILLGYDWESLGKDEKINVLRAWWLNIGIPQFLGEPDVVNEGRNKGVIH